MIFGQKTKVIPLPPKSCARIRKSLDSYLSNELLPDTSQEILRHLERCQECSEALQVRLRVKSRLQQAVRQEIAPRVLRNRIRKSIRNESPHSGSRWLLAAEAVLLLFLGGWSVFYESNPTCGHFHLECSGLPGIV